ncbi:hypothetical protein M6D93_14200 [Jatrophihabitans telluris]|uniref:Uncharacterized protein n=1 Tax=Jatrophihabitans telluris TaxID=2038343 RepID=A0ABY4QVT7_9ACTN|nr:hypothetical protein [Jatrophihabitans telluris]UQX87448.1 hypothetical protein M6D93_14200 [Jatrophihabitans telluris]
MKPSHGLSSPHSDHYFADLIERLAFEYEGTLSVCFIVDVVRQCRAQLAGSPKPALPELVERLARCRLEELTEAKPDSAPGGRLGTDVAAGPHR